MTTETFDKSTYVNPFQSNQYQKTQTTKTETSKTAKTQEARQYASNTTFTPATVRDYAFGNTHAPRGHFIYNYLEDNRSEVSGIAGLTSVAKQGFIDVTAFAGRIWYLHPSGDVLFSRVIENRGKDEARCYQDGDPTSEATPDVLDDDGGMIRIEGINKPKCFMFFVSQLVVAAENGIWVFVDEEGVFSATGYGVSKISDRGILNKASYVNANGIPVWWSDTGIYCITSDPNTSSATVQSLTKGRIQALYEEIPAVNKQYTRGVYDKANSVIQWLYSDLHEEPYHLDKVLLLNTKLNAWHKWSIQEANSYEDDGVTYYAPYLGIPFSVKQLLSTVINDPVVDNTGETVTDILGTPVTISKSTGIASSTTANYLCFSNRDNEIGFTFGSFNDRTFVDWQSYDNEGTPYDSYISFAYELNEDMMRVKQAPYIQTFFNRTETAWVAGEDGLEFNFPSSCYMSARWDWVDKDATKRISAEQQVYRMKQYGVPSAPQPFDNGYPVTTSKTKVRGRGKALQLHFRSEDRKDFDLIGWSISFTGSSKA